MIIPETFRHTCSFKYFLIFYAVRLSEDNNRSVVEELEIKLRHFPFEPTVGIAQSPDGKIYYGGYQIYTLDSIGEREQIYSLRRSKLTFFSQDRRSHR